MDGNDGGVGYGRNTVVIGPAVVDFVTKTNHHVGYTAAVGIGVERNGVLLGGVVFCDFYQSSIQIHVASTGTRNWVTREWLHVIFDYAFRQLGVKRVIGIVPEANEAALNFDLKVGFQVETRIKEMFDGKDALVIYMTRDMCKWIDYERFPHERRR